LPKTDNKNYSLAELNNINVELLPLKELANRELSSIYGLTGMVYTPHIDAYMKVCVQKAAILSSLKKQGILPLSSVEQISSILDNLHKKVRNRTIVNYEGNNYQRRFTPLKLSKSEKNVRTWAKFWLLQLPNGKVDPCWESQVREIWPEYFLIRTINN